jgi:hypothetical protein
MSVEITYTEQVIDLTVTEQQIDVNVTSNPIDVNVTQQVVEISNSTGININTTVGNLVTLVRNQTGSTIPAFTAVYISGATGNKPTISLASAAGEISSSKTFGLTATSIANNQTGFVVTIGELINVNTQAYNEGDLLWLSPTAGQLQTTQPIEPNHAVFIGYVVRSHPTQGVVEVRIANGYELDELHGVFCPTPSDGDVLQYVASTGLWTKTSSINFGTW